MSKEINLVELCGETAEFYLNNLVQQKVYKPHEIYKLSATENSNYTELGQDLFNGLYDDFWVYSEGLGFKNEE